MKKNPARPCIFLLLVFLCFQQSQAATAARKCFSCRIEIDNLIQPKSLEGAWLFTRNDLPSNALPATSTKDWVLVEAPGPWSKAYNDKQLFRVGWYRGNFHFNESMIGQKVVFYIDAYMSKMTVYLDGKVIYDRYGQDSHKKYYSIQPVPIAFDVTGTDHVITVRIDTLMMLGIYQSPFQLRSYQYHDPFLNFIQIFCGELRYLFAYIFLWTGLFYLLLYSKTKYKLYLVSGLTGIGIYPFYAMPNDITIKIFDPETLLILHYPGIGFMALGYFFFSQYFHKFTPRLAIFYSAVIASYGLAFLYMSIDFHLGFFQIARKTLFLASFATATHGVINCIIGFRKDPRIRPAIVGMIIFWICSGHDILLALGLIKSTSLIFIGTFGGIFSIMLITARLFAETFTDNRRLLKKVESINAGLERTVIERTSSLREKTNEISSILESLPQGVVEADQNLVVLGNFSDALKHVLGESDIEGRELFDLLFTHSNLVEDAYAKAKSALFLSVGESRFTFEVNSSALPQEIVRKVGKEDRILALGWSVICDDADVVDKFLVTVTDISKQKGLEKESAQFKLRARIMEGALNNSTSRVVRLVQQSREDLFKIWQGSHAQSMDTAAVYRELHTLKGNCRLYELTDLSNLCHRAETRLEVYKAQTTEANFKALSIAMNEVITALDALNELIDSIHKSIDGQRTGQGMAVHPTVLQELDRQAQKNGSLLHLVRALQFQPARSVTEHFPENFRTIAKSLGKSEVVFQSHINENLLIDPQFSKNLENLLSHLVRNSLDHGIETPEQRQHLGKSSEGHIQIDLAAEQDALILHYRDDGAGLDLEKIRDKAFRQGLCDHDESSTAAIVACIFAPGFSTAKTLTEISGRGVGMDVVMTEIERWNGQYRWMDHKEKLSQSRTAPFNIEIRFPLKLAYAGVA